MGNQRKSVPSVQDLFAAALDLAPDQRAAFLQAACAGAPARLRLIEELLVENDRAGSFLAAPLFASDPSSDVTVSSASSAGGRYIAASDSTIVLPRFRPLQLIAGRFQVVRFIARGGMGEVYEVRDQHLQGGRFALKIIRPEIAAAAGSSQRFEQEVLLARKVSHPNLCPIYDFSRCEDPPPLFLLLIMKLLEGETLDARLKSGQPISPDQATDICNQLIRGVGAMHDVGVIHRDLKPNNVMLEQSTNSTDPTHPRLCVYIMDFGLARLHESEQSVVRTGIAGTPGYIAPELFAGQRPTQATDLYALGIVLHQVLTGKRPEEQQRALGVKPLPSLRASAAPPHLVQAVEDLLSTDPEQRCRAFDNLYAAIESRPPVYIRTPTLLTRRQMIVGAGATACALATGTVLRRHQLYDSLYDSFHPLPQKRFVAVLNWPPTKDPKIRPMISGLLDAISNELARAEAYDHNFFVTTPRQAAQLNAPKDLVDTSESLGTNLVLAASATLADNNHFRVLLRVLDPNNPRTLRSRDFRTTLDQVFSLPQQAVHIAAELLDVSNYKPNDERNRIGTDNHEAYEAFQAAELFRKQDNDVGLEKAIEQYNKALDLDPHYAEAQSGLAWAYLRSAGIHQDGAVLSLARQNAEAALAKDPDLVEAHTALAWALEQAGEREGAEHEMATALSLDPSNPHTLTYQAKIYSYNSRYAQAEQTFQAVLKLRPNLWVAHNDLGALLDSQGKYQEALLQFRQATVIAPKSAMAFGNLGGVYLQLGQIEDAVDACRSSLALRPSDDAATTLATALRIRGQFPDAISSARMAVKLNPALSTNWLELGDSYQAAGKYPADALSAYRQGAAAQKEELRIEPKKAIGWMLLGLCQTKAGDPSQAPDLMSKAESLGANDLTSLLFKVRTLALLRESDECLARIADCLKQGATPFQFQTMPDLEKVRADPRYGKLIESAPAMGQASTS